MEAYKNNPRICTFLLSLREFEFEFYLYYLVGRIATTAGGYG